MGEGGEGPGLTSLLDLLPQCKQKPASHLSPCYTNMRAVITYRAAAYGHESLLHAFTCTYTLSVN